MAAGEKEKIYGFNEFDKNHLISIIGTGQRTYPEGAPRGGSGGGGRQKVARTPSTGINAGAFSGSNFLSPSATCEVFDLENVGGRNEWVGQGETISVLNISDSAIAGDVLIKVAQVSTSTGKVWVVDVAGCGTGGTSLQSWF